MDGKGPKMDGKGVSGLLLYGATPKRGMPDAAGQLLREGFRRPVLCF